VISRRQWLKESLGVLSLPAKAVPTRGRRAMVVTEEPLATAVGVEVLRQGGNAVDAAVAVAFALAVTYPQAGNLGGGGFLLYWQRDGFCTCVDFRETAPRAASESMYEVDHEASLVGWRACGVPGTVRGLEWAYHRYGRLPWRKLIEPAIRLAEGGFPVPCELASALRASARLPRFAESRRIYLKNGQYWQAGEVFRQPELAWTLRRIARYGAADFYEGEIARRLSEAMERSGGLITLQDLKAYRAKEREPLRGRYGSRELVTAPPPSSGGVGLLQMLGVLEGSGYDRSGWGSATMIHWVAEAMRRFFADRSEYLGDPDYVDVRLPALLDPAYLERRRAGIDPRRATPSHLLGPGLGPTAKESSETTHLSVVDPEGNAVALTYTLNGTFGSGVTVPGLGFLLNNEMDDFTTRPDKPNLFGLIQGRANRVEPGKRPLSSMTPTVVLKSGLLELVLGSPGGPRIISAVLQVLLNIADFKMGIQSAVVAPRFHHQWQPDVLQLEPGFSPDTVELLRARGHRIELAGAVGKVSAILVGEDGLEGVADPRGYGKAEGW